ncbi:MAG: hypothetical protein RL728_270 [Bacteroidota bacterium]|jgi:hypothetical protein
MRNILNISVVMFFFTTSILDQDKESSFVERISCEKIDIGCLILGRETNGEHIIRNEFEYQKLLNERSDHSNCGNYELPAIDFNRYTLIGYISSIEGCDFPQISFEIIKQNNQYSINLTIIQKGLCKRNNPVKVWYLIPKIDESSTINFNIERSTNSK